MHQQNRPSANRPRTAGERPSLRPSRVLWALAAAALAAAGLAATGLAATPAPQADPPARGAAPKPAAPSAAAAPGTAADRNWPQWRGPLGTGEAPHADPPVRWSETENVRWKTEIPGRGHSTPAVWGDRVFVTAAIPSGDPVPAVDPHGAHDNAPSIRRQRFVALALDRGDGRILWQRTLGEEVPRESGHLTASFASPSPVTDGERLFAYFGSHGLYALDLEGKLLWQADLGDMETLHGHGEGSSPALAGDAVVVNWDHEGQSFLAAFDTATGERRWRVERDEPTSWATPIVVEEGGRRQVVVSGTRRIRGYDPATGGVLWECGGLSSNVVASPVAGGGMVFAGSSYEKRSLLAIHLDGARGDLTGTDRVAWTRDRATPYVPSPLLYRGALYYLSHYQGILTRLEARTGRDRPGAFRLAGLGNVYASPVAAAGRVYITDLAGATLVLSDGDQPEVLALNRLDDRFSASAAVAGRELFLRGERRLYCLAQG